MKFGASIFPTEDSISVVELGRALEAMGFESLWLPEHSHIPLRGARSLALEPEYSRMLDPFCALAAVASTTSVLKLGTAICQVPQRHPITLAKEVATLDCLSGGRFLFGVGAGWLREELRNHGVDPKVRFEYLAERLRAMQAIWSSDEAEYHGSLVDFGPIWSWPKPCQRPHPPILVGGWSRCTLRLVASLADGWMPLARGVEHHLEQQMLSLRELAHAAGRPPPSVTVAGVAAGAAAVERYAKAGVERCVLHLPSAQPERVLRLVNHYGRLIPAFRD